MKVKTKYGVLEDNPIVKKLLKTKPMNIDEQIALDKYIAHLIWGLMLVPPKERSEESLMKTVSQIKR